VRLTDIMSTKLVVLTLEHTIKEAAQIFLDNQIDGAPVVNEKGELLGLLTKSHIYRVIAQDQNPASLVGDIMNPDLTVGHPDEEVKDIFDKVGRLPVVDKKVVVGIKILSRYPLYHLIYTYILGIQLVNRLFTQSYCIFQTYSHMLPPKTARRLPNCRPKLPAAHRVYEYRPRPEPECSSSLTCPKEAVPRAPNPFLPLY
jgi:hypothetical protein